jgi:hypothetical protein
VSELKPAVSASSRIPLLLGSAAGFLAGALLGARYHFLDSSGASGGLFPVTFFITLAAIVLAGGGTLLGLVLLIPSGTRAAGRAILALAVAAGAGFPVGAALGPSWQFPIHTPGTLHLELAAPVDASLDGTVDCVTAANSTVVASLLAPRFGRVGVDEVGLTIGLAAGQKGTIQITVNGTFAYEGTVDTTGPGATGSADLTGVPETGGNRLGGPSGQATLDGAVSWSCISAEPDASSGPAATGPTAHTPGPTPDTGGTGDLQGWFVLTGVVAIDPLGSDPPIPLPGRALGSCRADLDLRTDRFDTVVDWVGGTRAHLILLPSRDSATLTVELDDGSAPRTVTAPATIEELMAGTSGIVAFRRIHASFELREGRLGVMVEWSCPESLER